MQVKVSRAAWTICHDPELYPNPESFVPERSPPPLLPPRIPKLADPRTRWLNLSRDEETQLWDQSMIFSYGPRVCLGKEYSPLPPTPPGRWKRGSAELIFRMALMELRMLVAALVMKYTWTGVPDKPGRWDQEMVPFDTTVLHPTSGRCVLKFALRK